MYPYSLDTLLAISGLNPAVSGMDPAVGALTLNPTLQAALSRLVSSTVRVPSLNDVLAAQQAHAQERISQRLGNLAVTNAQPSLPLGCDSDIQFPAGVPALTTVILTCRANDPVKVINFTVDDSIAEFFKITLLMVKRTNLLLGAAPVPASRFLRDSRRPPFETEPIPANIEIQVGVQNLSAEIKRFYSTFDCIVLPS